MHKLLVFYPRPESPEKFKTYYVNKHIPLAAQIPGLKSSRYSFDVAGIGQDSPYFCIWEGEFDSQEALHKAMTSDIGKAVGADVPNYATAGAIVVVCNPVEVAPK